MNFLSYKLLITCFMDCKMNPAVCGLFSKERGCIVLKLLFPGIDD